MGQTASGAKENSQPLYYVGIGASAGGLEALQDFFRTMPSDTGMAFIVIQHLSPDYRSMMDELLARHTDMNISVAEDGMQVVKNCIYLIPPRANLMMFHGKLYLEEQSNQRTPKLPIDVFFRSLASDQGKKCIAVILSGTGSDGTLGIRAIKEAGGIIMVQDEKTAKFDGMPRSSISTGLVDFVLPAADMAEELLNYVQHPLIKEGKSLEKSMPRNVDTLTKINIILRDHVGIDFSYYKENTITRRLERRISITRCATIEDYLQLLIDSDKEKDVLYRELLIGVTRFFRDGDAYASLQENVLAKIDWKKEYIRVWSAGCSTGEEVYSIAMMCLEEMQRHGADGDLKVFATDIDRDALNVASQGHYPESIVADVEPSLLAKYFNRVESGYQVKESVRKRVVFATHNLLKDPPFSRLDLMVCRNLFIYLKPEMQQKILNMFYYSLRPGGYLFMGSSETLGEMSEGFRTVDSKWKIYAYQEGFRPPMMNDAQLVQQVADRNEGAPTGGRLGADALRQSRLCEGALEAYLPPSVIVDKEDRIVHVINDMNPFFRVRAGQFSNQLMKNLPNELALYASGILRRLRQGQQRVSIDSITGLDAFTEQTLSIEGSVLEVDSVKFYMISFRLVAAQEAEDTQGGDQPDFNHEMSQRVKELERELQASRENLQATVEELETSNEELQASNEELIASNEELQSTNEELQSVNEELYTVNSEYQTKIDELTQANNDLLNLLHNTEIGAIYLDRDLCIRRITPIISRVTHLRESDIGRPLSHIAPIEFFPDLVESIDRVLENLQEIDKEIVDSKGRTWFARVRPYRTSYHSVEGILITFVEISQLKHLEAKLLNSHKLLETVLEYSPLAKTMVNANGEIVYANRQAEKLFGISRQQISQRTYDHSQWEITDLNGDPISGDQLPFGRLKRTRRPVEGFQHYVQVPGKDRVLLNISGVPVLREDGSFDGGVFALQEEVPDK